MHDEYNYNIQFEPQEIITKSKKKYLIKGYFSTIDEDLSNEVLTEEAQKDILAQVKGRTITLDAEHEVYYDKSGKPLNKPTSNIPIGKVIDAELTTKGVFGTVEINESSPRFKNIWDSIKGGYLHSFSVAFYPVEAVKKKIGDAFKSFVNKLNLINITLTGTPMNPNATFTPVMKSAIHLMDSFNTYDLNHNNEVHNMTEDTKLKSEPQEEVQEEVQVEDTDDIQDNEEVPQEQEATKKSKESEDNEVKEPKIDVKSIVASLKAEFNESLSKEKAIYLKSLEDAKEDFTKELKALKEQVEKLENQPIKKSIKGDNSQILAKKEEFSVFNLM